MISLSDPAVFITLSWSHLKISLFMILPSLTLTLHHKVKCYRIMIENYTVLLPNLNTLPNNPVFECNLLSCMIPHLFSDWPLLARDTRFTVTWADFSPVDPRLNVTGVTVLDRFSRPDIITPTDVCGECTVCLIPVCQLAILEMCRFVWCECGSFFVLNVTVSVHSLFVESVPVCRFYECFSLFVIE